MILFTFGVAGSIQSPVTRVPWALTIGWLLAIVPLVFAIQYYIRTPNHDGEECECQDPALQVSRGMVSGVWCLKILTSGNRGDMAATWNRR